MLQNGDLKKNERQTLYDRVYMHMALAVSNLSYAIRHKVGAVIVSSDGQVVSQGFNGTPSGFTNVCEYAIDKDGFINHSNPEYSDNSKELDDAEFKFVVECNENPDFKLKTKPIVLHAESNAITKCAKWGSSTSGATLYVTMSPCIECSKLIIQSGIKRVVYLEQYRDTSGIDLLKDSNVEVQQINIQ